MPARPLFRVLLVVLLPLAACHAPAPSASTVGVASGSTAAMPASDAPAVAARSMEQAGEYLTLVASCNDCHTQGWAENQGKVAPADRLAGNDLGYRGPWGTSYGKNLRQVVQRTPEDRWVEILRTSDGGDGRPPMPWWDTKRFSDRDLRAMYRYIKSLGPKVNGVPRGLPPGREPTGRFVWLTVQPPKTGG
ncbi:MAG: cytochrome C [Gemmatimonadaceae bacterium]|nr:cytochrome C [Gemmatimonadaceae bacterium]